MSIEVGAQVLVAALGLVGATFPFLAARAQHRGQQSDLSSIVAVLSALPENSPMRQRLEEHAESLVRLLVDRSLYRRDPAGIVLGLTFIAVAVGGGAAAANAGGFWLWLLIRVVVGAFGMTLDAMRRKRGGDGNQRTKRSHTALALVGIVPSCRGAMAGFA